MALSVTPTSGEPPYVVDITFNNAENFGNYFSFEFARETAVGECILDYEIGDVLATATASLLSTGTATINTAVPPGSCAAFNARIRRLSDNIIVSGSTVTVDNA